MVTGIAADYLHTAHAILDRIGQTQGKAIEAAARACAAAIAGDHLVHVFGSGHSRMLVEETWPRYGSFPGFHPIVELSLTNYHQVSGSNGQRQAMFLENVSGLAAQIARNFRFDPADVLLAISSGGTSVVTVEMAEIAASKGLTVIALTSVEHSRRAAARAPSGRRLFEAADIVIDTCTPVGDAAVTVAGLDEPVAPASTVAGAAIVNAVKARIAELMVAEGVTPSVLTSALLVGEARSAAAFDAAYDEHARRVAEAYQPR
jgi:uncharacterized phosphosugar-binding protein